MYAPVLLELFRAARDTGKDKLIFTYDEIRAVARRNGFEIRNYADFPYYFRSRSELPAEIREAGFRGLYIGGGRRRGGGTIILTKEELSFELPTDLPPTRRKSAIPPAVRKFIGDDEQAVLSVVRYEGLLDDLLGFQVYHLQGHLRTTIDAEQGNTQVEVDDLYVGVRGDAGTTIVPVEAKAVAEKLNRVQLLYVARAAYNHAAKAVPANDVEVCPVAVKLDGDGTLYAMTFNFPETFQGLTILRAKRYHLEPLPWQQRGRRRR